VHGNIYEWVEDCWNRNYEGAPTDDSVVLVAGLNDSMGVSDGKPFSNSGRVTFVIAKRAVDWKIVHFHRSAMPR
jgi:formylglycine-generating enzyme required for sulfatase activity